MAAKKSYKSKKSRPKRYADSDKKVAAYIKAYQSLTFRHGTEE